MKKAILYVLLIPILHCSFLITRFVPQSPGFGHYYIGTERAVVFLECGLYHSAPALFIPFPFYIADIPLSFVLDTIWLPVDLLVARKKNRYPLPESSCH